jgi:hypothetical protein
MHATLRKFSSGVLLTLLATAVVFVGSGPTYAQSNTRSFQMGLWGYPSPAIPPSADTDIAAFYEGQNQPLPPIRSIVILASWATTPLSAYGYDWSRIVAVEIDEPYTPIDSTITSTIDNSITGLTHCANVPAQASTIDATLAQRAAELEALAPKARFWVNLTNTEAGFIESESCWASVFNKPYIDVISADWYYVDFGTLSTFYATLAANPANPGQQLALIPGTFHRTGTDSPPNAATSASYLQGYFDYANDANQSCNLPLGSRGATGSFDGCRVWIVLGFLTGTFTQDNNVYMGEQDPTSGPIATTWRAELALPLRPGLAHQLTPGQILSAILPLLLNQ